MAAPSTVVFIGGVGLRPWIWDEVRAALPSTLNTVVAPRPDPLDSSSLADYARRALESVEGDSLALVGHSCGGVIAAEMLNQAPERVSDILLISALLPRAGSSFVGSMPWLQRTALKLGIKTIGTRPPDKAIYGSLTIRLDSAIAERVAEEYLTESPRLFVDQVSPYKLPKRRGYIMTHPDKELPSRLQKRYIRTLKPTWLKEFDSGHMPMLEKPAELAAAIEDYWNDVPAR